VLVTSIKELLDAWRSLKFEKEHGILKRSWPTFMFITKLSTPWMRWWMQIDRLKKHASIVSLGSLWNAKLHEDFALEEIQEATYQMFKGKTLGHDRAPLELFQAF
jgi:hypothetical protein